MTKMKYGRKGIYLDVSEIYLIVRALQVYAEQFHYDKTLVLDISKLIKRLEEKDKIH